MKLITFLALTFLTTTGVNAQKFHVNVFAGMSNYTGDLQDKRFTFNQSHLALGAGVSYEITEKFLLNGGLMFGKVSADDKNNQRNTLRNLNFSSKLSEAHVTGEYYFRNLYEYSVSPYIFAGLALYHFNPYTFDSAGTQYFLKPLSTEGEGFLQGKNKYNLTQLAIPFGGGLKFALNDNVRLGVEIGMRKLFTDYLDDVSTSYVDQNLLLQNRGPKAVELAFRGGELKSGVTYPEGGSQRGGSAKKDWSYFTGLTASFRIGGDGSSNGKMSSRTGCPAKVY
jgi:opacity protein-like surface antigen